MPLAGDAGTYFYHSHVGFQANTATGLLIVEDQGSPAYQYDEDRFLFLQDYYPKEDSVIQEGLLANPFQWSGEPEAITINGFSGNTSFVNASDPSCTPYTLNVAPGKTYRLRFASSTALSLVTLGIEGHDNLTIIEADGEDTKPWSSNHLQIGSGQRFSVLFKTRTEAELRAANKTNYWLRYENRDRPTNVSGYALLQYDLDLSQPAHPDLPSKPPITLPKNVTAWAEYALEPFRITEPFPQLSEVTRTVTITMSQVIHDGAYINKTINGTLQWA
jgi:L-ascorbate oxidase